MPRAKEKIDPGTGLTAAELRELDALLAIKHFEFRGAARQIQTCTLPEWILSGPSETGKTVATLYRLNHELWTHPGGQYAMIRKRRADMDGTVIQLFIELFVKPAGGAIRTYGGEKPEWFDYANGARLWVGGLDNPGKVLSSARDGIYVNQAEELTLEDWETLSTRTTGRAGHTDWPMLFGDCNPAGSKHWIITRKGLKVLNSYHRDNPALYTEKGKLTAQGKRTMTNLGNLTGHRKKRLLEGLWASPEGLVYETFDAIENLTEDDFDPSLPFEIGVDDGYVDPRHILFIQRTPTRILIFDEMVHSKHLAETCVKELVERCGEYFGWTCGHETEGKIPSGHDVRTCESRRPRRLPDVAVGPPEAKELQTRFRMADILYRWSDLKDIVSGIEIVRRLICDADGYRAIKIHRHRCPALVAELSDGYVYPTTGTRKNDELPVDAFNHGADALRYWITSRARR